MRSQYMSASTTPASVSGCFGFALSYTKVL